METGFCNKKCWPERSVAKHFARVWGLKQRIKLTEYWCEKCDGYHVSSMEPSRIRDNKGQHKRTLITS